MPTAFRKTAAGVVVLLSLAWIAAGVRAEEDRPERVSIGVLAMRGSERCLADWAPTAAYLNDAIPEYSFDIVPLAFQDVSRVVASGRLAFVLVSPALYVDLEDHYDTGAIATLITGRGGLAGPHYSGAIFCRADNPRIHSFADLQGSHFVAVHQTELGGWLMQLRELKLAGMDPARDFAQLTFAGTQDDVVQAVRDGSADAGAVRADFLQQMVAEGLVPRDAFRVLPAPPSVRFAKPFSYPVSTRAYPEWPMAALPSTPLPLATRVAIALLAMPADAGAAKAAGISGWVTADSYQPVRECLRELRVAPYEDYGRVTVREVVKQHWGYLAALAAALFIMGTALVRRRVAVRNLRASQGSLRTALQMAQEQVAVRRHTEEALRASEESLREHARMLEHAPVLVRNLKDEIILWNSGMERMYGFSSAEAVGKTCHALLRTTASQPLAEIEAEFRRAGRWEGELRHCTRDGRQLFVASLWVLHADTVGEPAAIIEVNNDITARKQAEEALAASEARYRRLFEAAKDGVLILDPDTGQIADANPCLMALLGYSRNELVGKRLDQIGLFRDSDACRALLEKLRKEDYVRYEDVPVQTRDGQLRAVEFVGSVYLVDRKRVIQCNVRDITERRRAEDALRQANEEVERRATELSAVLDSMVEGVSVYDAAGTCVRTNPALRRVYGVNLAGWTVEQQAEHFRRVMLRRADGQMLAPEERPVFHALRGEVVADHTLVMTHPDGRAIVLAISATPLLAGGAIVGAVTVAHDITERTLAEAERDKMQARVQQAQKLESLAVLAGGIAHDFNNLLQVVLGYGELALLKLAGRPEEREWLEKIMEAARHAAKLSRQMLAFAGKGPLVALPVDLSRIVGDTCDLVAVSVSKNIVLDHALPPGLPAVDADASQLRQVAMNLLLNAAEAIGAKAGHITVTTGVTECTAEELRQPWLEYDPPAGRYVFLQVKDDGCGMDSATLAKVFDPFFTTKFTGRGLGMSVVLGIVRGHHGAIQVTSVRDRGTASRILFPASARNALERIPLPPTPMNVKKTASGTVLVVDDDAGIRHIVADALQRMGFIVLTAEDGAKALEVYRSHSQEISLVLLDLTMPNMDGEQTLASLLKLRPSLPVLMWTGYGAPQFAQRLQQQGAAGFIEKPFSLPDLMKRVSTLVAAGTPSAKG